MPALHRATRLPTSCVPTYSSCLEPSAGSPIYLPSATAGTAARNSRKKRFEGNSGMPAKPVTFSTTSANSSNSASSCSAIQANTCLTYSGEFGKCNTFAFVATSPKPGMARSNSAAKPSGSAAKPSGSACATATATADAAAAAAGTAAGAAAAAGAALLVRRFASVSAPRSFEMPTFVFANLTTVYVVNVGSYSSVSCSISCHSLSTLEGSLKSTHPFITTSCVVTS
mmetsp:Transcript_157723/g.505844  ORF Transcript_157723/g.505844 Transcript_157723/m.505844 type:complete len:227 (-) Transcript_157723:505-1185(-)